MLIVRSGLIALVLAGVLAGCTDTGEAPRDRAADGGPAFETRPADAARTAPETPSYFAFLRYSVDVEGDAPRLCLGFTEPLDPDTDYSAYVALEPSRPAALSVSGQSLCIGGLGFGEGQSVVLREGFPSADGDALAADERIDVDFGDRPAYVGIAGDGVILPRLDADGLAIETVNVDTVDIRLFRITDRALAFRSITTGFNGMEGEWNWVPDDERAEDVGELLWEGQMDTGGELNAPVTTVFPIADTIETLQPGAYYVEIVDAAEAGDDYRSPARAVRWLVITDLALTAYRGSDGADFVVRSLQTAQPVPGVQVELIAQSNEVLGTARTDASGHARFDAPLLRGEHGMAPRLLLAYGPDGDFAVLDFRRNPVDLTGQNVGGRQRPGAADGYLYLDRGIYRPGETVRLSAMVRDAEAVAISDRPVTLTAFAPNGIEAARARFEQAEQAGTVFWDYDLPAAAARGEWRIEAEMDGHGRVGTVRFAVEDFVPQRVGLDLVADDETPIYRDETRDIEARVRFLYGAPGAGLPVEARLRVETDPSPFDNWSDFSFGRGDEPFREVSRDLRAATADGAGRATITVDPQGDGEGATQPLRIRTVVSAIEPGGRAVADDVRIPYRPAPLYLGLDPQFEGRAERNRENAIDVIALSPQGEPVAARVTWRLVRIDWNYDWYRTDSDQWQWRRSRNVVLIEDGEMALDGAGAGRLDLRALDWGNYQLVVSHEGSGMSASADFWVGWGSSAEPGNEAPDRVAISGPDRPVAVGDTATLTILPPYPGEAEVVIAGERVIETRAITVPEGGAQISFEVTEEWGGGAYAMVSVYTPRDPVTQPAPRRAVGIAHMPVDVSDRTLEIGFDVPERVHPRQTLTLDLDIEGAGRNEAWVTVAAVDEGILALTRFASPDPIGHFFGKTALNVDLFDDYGRLLDPNQGAAADIRSGGDQIGGAGLTVVPTRTVALFSGPVRIGRGGAAQVEFEIPDFNGELRLMAVAWTDRAMGQADRPLTVRDDVPAELVLPRFLAPGDISTATLTIDNVDGPAGPYAAAIEATGAVEADATDRIELAQGERADRRHEIRGVDTGIGAIGLRVEGPGNYAVSHGYPIEVRSAWLPSSEVTRGRVMPGDSWRLSSNALANYLPGTARVSVSFSATPLDEAALLESLSRYPYGCTEQIVSRALPLLYADALASASGADGPAGARAQVQEAIATLLNRQSGDGAIGLWRIGDGNASPWLGAYAVDFLTRAKEEGYAVPDAALERAYTALGHIANREMWRATGYDSSIYRWQGQTDTEERLADRSAAYALYVLARAGRADRSRLRYMHDQRMAEMASPLAMAQIAAALHSIGDQARTQSALDAAEAALGFENRGNYYQSPRRDLAGILALAAEAGDADRVARLAERVVVDLPEPDRLTTQETAFLLLAAQALSGGGEAVTVSAPVDPASAGGEPRFELTAGDLDRDVAFEVSGDSAAWVTQIAHGETASAPGGASEGLEVQKRIRRLDGSPAPLDRLVQGDRLMVEILLTPGSERLIPAVLVDLLPPGFEIEAVVRPEEAGSTGLYNWLDQLGTPRIAESRDDRFVAAFDLRGQRSARAAYIVRAVTPGRYTLPGSVAEDMYRPDVFARSATGEVVIAPRD